MTFIVFVNALIKHFLFLFIFSETDQVKMQRTDVTIIYMLTKVNMCREILTNHVLHINTYPIVSYEIWVNRTCYNFTCKKYHKWWVVFLFVNQKIIDIPSTCKRKASYINRFAICYYIIMHSVRKKRNIRNR